MAVLIEQTPGVVLLVAENKKDDDVPRKKPRMQRDADHCSQLGQALFYALGHQLKACQHKLPPLPEIAMYMADGKFIIVVATMGHTEEGDMILTLRQS